MTPQQEYRQRLRRVLERDSRYPREAYAFVHAVLDYAQRQEQKTDLPETQRHVSGQQLLVAMQELALEEFGPMAATVMSEWGISSGEDFGNLVFNLIEADILSASETDRPEDFAGCEDLNDALEAPFTQAGTPPPSLPAID